MSPSTELAPDDSREVCGAGAWPTDARSARQWPTDELFSVLLPNGLRYLTKSLRYSSFIFLPHLYTFDHTL
jgi:hypothetical protein